MMHKNPRPRKYASDAERQAAHRARYSFVSVRLASETAETLERISASTQMPVTELARQMIMFALCNRDWYNLPTFVRTLTNQSRDDRRCATKFQPRSIEAESDEDDSEN